MDGTDHDLRARVVDAAIAAYRSGDFHTVGPAEVACRADTPVAEVTRLFPVWELLVVAVVDRWSVAIRRDLRHLAERDGTVAFLRALLEAHAADTGYSKMRLGMMSAASNPDHPAAGWFRAAYVAMYEELIIDLGRDVVMHREPTTMAPRHAAEQLLALYEGLQLQALLRDDADLLPAFDRAVARMRAGWRSAYAASA